MNRKDMLLLLRFILLKIMFYFNFYSNIYYLIIMF